MRRVFLTALLFGAPALALAALIPTYSTLLDLSMTPQYPRPGASVTLSANYLGDRGGTTYLWSVDDEIVLQGIGAKTLTLTAGLLGSVQTVSVIAEEQGVPKAAAQAILRSADVDMIWEGRTVVPPLYSGRPLPNGGSDVVLLAVPHLFVNGRELPGNTLVYEWREGGTPVGSASGYGKSSITVTPPRFGDAFTVSVRARTVDGLAAAEGSAVIQPQNPSAVVYEYAPLIGVRFERSIAGAFAFTEGEVSFRAFPLFVTDADSLTYEWALNGEVFSVDPERPRDVTFRKVGSGSGSHTVTFSFSNIADFLENAQSSFSLTF